jgi:glycosyltransferase involved in cell wall biosynthesis
MKLIFYNSNNYAHKNNRESIERMCKSCNIDYEYTSNQNVVKTSAYDFLICNDTYISPNDVPENVKIIYGPQFFVFPEGIFRSKYRPELKNKCVYNCLSEWVKTLYLEHVNGSDNFMIDIAPLPFGVNTEKFKPEPDTYKDIDCLIYYKSRKRKILDKVVNILEKLNKTYKVISYGSYTENEYINLLHKSKFMILVDRHESQGFAIQEAMSTNIPMIVLNAESMFDETDSNDNSIYEKYKGKYNCYSTTVPYWSEKCGILTNSENFSEKDVIELTENLEKYSKGREYIEEVLSDKVCMERIINYFTPHFR